MYLGNRADYPELTINRESAASPQGTAMHAHAHVGMVASSLCFLASASPKNKAPAATSPKNTPAKMV